MSEQEKYIEAIKKRALGYEYEEIQTLIEETTNGTKKKIIKTKKHLPPDVETCKFLLKQMKTPKTDFKELLKDFDKQIQGVIKDGNCKNRNK